MVGCRPRCASAHSTMGIAPSLAHRAPGTSPIVQDPSMNPRAPAPVAPDRRRTRSSTISPRGEERMRRGHPWIYRADVAPGGRRGGRYGDDARAARPAVGRGALQRSVANRASRAHARRARGGRRPLARAARGCGALSRGAGHRRDGLSRRARRGGPAAVARWSTATATGWSCRPCRRAWTACSVRSPAGWWTCSAREASSRGTIRASGNSKGSSSPSRCCMATCPAASRSSSAACGTRSIPGKGRRPGCSSTSVRTARRRRATRAGASSTRSATTEGSRSRSHRTPTKSSRSTSPLMRWPASRGMPRSTASGR